MNTEIKNMIRTAKLTQWQVAERLGVSEFTLLRWLRYELPSERRAAILQAIEELKGEKA